MVSTCALAVDGNPAYYTNQAINRISPDGRYVVCEMYSMVTIMDRVNNQTYEYYPDETTGAGYTVGQGNAISNTGIIVANIGSPDAPAYWKDGEWTMLNTGDASHNTCLAQGISADGSRIVGSIGLAGMTIEEDLLMQAPAYWDADGNGGFGEFVLLPHPLLDFTNRMPQYITAISISADGKTIAGQVVDYSGMMRMPIVYTQDVDGQWSYSLPVLDRFNPEHLELPAWPGEAPEYPQASDFMTPEQQAAYQQALDLYYSSGYDPELWPEVEDYMSETEKAAYTEAMAAYNTEFEQWNEQTTAYYDVLGQIQETSPCFEFNQCYLDNAGELLLQNNYVVDNSDPWSWFPVQHPEPWIINLTDKSVRIPEGATDKFATFIADGGNFVATDADQLEAYVYLNGAFVKMADYLKGYSPEFDTWVKDNLTHDVESYDWDEEGNMIINVNELVITGIPTCSSDLKYLGGFAYNVWDGDTMVDSWFADMSEDASVGNITAASKADVKSVTVYDVNGRVVAGDSSLQKGIYIISTTYTDGRTESVKVIK